jgi:hypothetical protein
MTQPSGGWCTNWDAYNTRQIWDMVSGEDDPQGWRQVNAWGNFEQAVSAQRRRLMACRQALAEKWPPDSSEASRVFIAEMDNLIKNMDASLQAASSTASGLAGIMQALASAKRELGPIRQEYEDKSSDLMIRQLDHAEDEIDARARQVMFRAEMAVSDYTPMIKPPPRYQLAVSTQKSFPAPSRSACSPSRSASSSAPPSARWRPSNAAGCWTGRASPSRSSALASPASSWPPCCSWPSRITCRCSPPGGGGASATSSCRGWRFRWRRWRTSCG